MRPVLLAVDDDPEVLRAVDRDLRRHYADRYRVARAEVSVDGSQDFRIVVDGEEDGAHEGTLVGGARG